LYERAIQYTQAESEYHKAINASVNYALPNFYLGRLYSKQDNTPASDIYINRALEVDPQLIEARLFKINNFIQKEDYSSAIQNVNVALQTNPIWQFYYLRAFLLFKLEQYEDAKTLILQTCIDINSHNIDEYLLLGDIYKALGDIVSSKIYYIEAGKIDSENVEYIERIKNLH
jgi:tetratricopeptide (TPR) repeat protein